jgi:multidrug efflux pump subunit AcrA (membrane-fusion protein)
MIIRFVRRMLVPAIVVAVLVGTITFIGGGAFTHREKEGWSDPTASASRDPVAVMVTVEPVTFRPIQRSLEVSGTLTGYEEVTISSKVEGRVKKIHKLVSQQVNPDEVLLEIDPVDATLAVQQAEKALLVELARLGMTKVPRDDYDLTKIPAVQMASVKLENARAKYDRAKKLAPREAISNEEVADRLADVRTAQVEYDSQIQQAKVGIATIQLKQEALKIARQALLDTTIRVPSPTLHIPGKSPSEVAYTVAGRMVGEGTLVRDGTEVFKLVIDSVVTLRVAVPERHPFSADLREGQEAEIWAGSMRRPVLGIVDRIHPTVDTTTRTFEVELRIPNESRKLKPGSFAKAAIHTKLDDHATMVPHEALVSFAGISKIFTFDQGKAREVIVTAGVHKDSLIEIVEPKIPEGTLIITSGQTALANKTPVAVRESTPPQASEGRK